MPRQAKALDRDRELSELAALQAEAAKGRQRAAPKTIPIRIVENLRLSAVTPDAVRRRLQGETVRSGPIVGIEWFLVDSDGHTAIYSAKCPYEFCKGKGDIVASTRILRTGEAELPFSDPGSLCCDECDSEIEAIYDRS